jgi:hypothetical protein
MAMSGMAARVENASIMPIATAPPVAPASIPITAWQSFIAHNPQSTLNSICVIRQIGLISRSVPLAIKIAESYGSTG